VYDIFYRFSHFEITGNTKTISPKNVQIYSFVQSYGHYKHTKFHISWRCEGM